MLPQTVLLVGMVGGIVSTIRDSGNLCFSDTDATLPFTSFSLELENKAGD